jgi:hypothetical protein
MVWTGVGWRWGPVEGCCDHSNEHSGFHKMLVSSWVAAQLAASQEGIPFICILVFFFVFTATFCFTNPDNYPGLPRVYCIWKKWLRPNLCINPVFAWDWGKPRKMESQDKRPDQDPNRRQLEHKCTLLCAWCSVIKNVSHLLRELMTPIWTEPASVTYIRRRGRTR